METTTTINSENLLTNSAYFLVMTNNTNCLWYKFSKINIWDWIISCHAECLEGNLEDWMTECCIEELTCLANRIEANAIYWVKRKKSLLNCQVFYWKSFKFNDFWEGMFMLKNLPVNFRFRRVRDIARKS